jgi:NAD(P)-dependent dehydrogenase (short-subunit alcohol dehydrogenase family)
MKTGPLTIVTGATRGLGQAMVEQLCAAGGHVVSISRRPVDGLADKISELEEQLNATIQDNIDLKESVVEYAREAVIREAAKDLSEAQAEKLKSLVEDISFDSQESFETKVATIKESYFKKSTVQAQSEEEQITEETDKVEVSPMMARYLEALKK